MMQALTDVHGADDQVTQVPRADLAAVAAVLALTWTGRSALV
jgi:hypothetical protein